MTGHLVNELPSDVAKFDLKKSSRWDLPRLVLRMANVLDDFDPDIIFTSLEYSALIASLARYFRNHPAKLALQKQSLPNYSRWNESLRGIKRVIDRFVDRNADLILVPSKNVKKEIEGRYFACPKCEIAFIPNAFDPSRVNSAVQVPNGSRPKLIVAMGRLEKNKGFDLLFRAVAQLPAGSAEVLLLGDGPERLELEKLARDLKIIDFVSFGGVKTDPFPLLSTGTIGVVPSQFESFGNVIIEMFAVGLPVIAFDVDYGPRELIRNGENGILVRNRNPESLAEAIAGLLSNAELRNQISGRAQADVFEHYSISKTVAHYQRSLTVLYRG
jgi:glycosyltransferase involved in cell wall biosynthesis